jgi:hypothetical protein
MADCADRAELAPFAQNGKESLCSPEKASVPGSSPKRDVPDVVGLSHEFEVHPGCFDEFFKCARVVVPAAEFIKVDPAPWLRQIHLPKKFKNVFRGWVDIAVNVNYQDVVLRDDIIPQCPFKLAFEELHPVVGNFGNLPGLRERTFAIKRNPAFRKTLKRIEPMEH